MTTIIVIQLTIGIPLHLLLGKSSEPAVCTNEKQAFIGPILKVCVKLADEGLEACAETGCRNFDTCARGCDDALSFCGTILSDCSRACSESGESCLSNLDQCVKRCEGGVDSCRHALFDNEPIAQEFIKLTEDSMEIAKRRLKSASKVRVINCMPSSPGEARKWSDGTAWEFWGPELNRRINEAASSLELQVIESIVETGSKQSLKATDEVTEDEVVVIIGHAVQTQDGLAIRIPGSNETMSFSQIATPETPVIGLFCHSSKAFNERQLVHGYSEAIKASQLEQDIVSLFGLDSPASLKLRQIRGALNTSEGGTVVVGVTLLAGTLHVAYFEDENTN